jgi:predicted dehydrogenase
LKYNIGIIGAGLIGRKRAGALIKSDCSRLIVISDINKKAAESLAQEFNGEVETDWEKVVNKTDIDVVIVATFNKFLAPISTAALKNKKHVLCEKPLGRNSEEAKTIIEIAKKSGVVLKTGFNHRHHPAIYKAKQLVDNYEIGNIYYLRCIYGHGGRPGYEKEWRASKDLCGGGELLDQGVHVVDLFRWFLGDFNEVYGQISTFYWNMEVEDNAFAIFRTKKGQVAMMHTSWTQWKNKFLFEVFGEKGYLIVDGLGGSYGPEKLIIGKRKKQLEREKMEIRDSIQYAGGPPDEEIIEYPEPDISWVEEWKEFVSAIKGNREPLGSGYDGLMANKMIEAVYQSAKLNKPVKIS